LLNLFCATIVDIVDLLTHRLLVYSAEYVVDELARKAHILGARLGSLQQLIEAILLYNGHRVRPLVLANLASYAHSLGKEFQKAVIERVDMQTEVSQAILRRSIASPHQSLDKRSESLWRNLLVGIAERTLGCWVRLDHQTIEAQVESLLCEGCYQTAAATYVARIREQG
jgi:hypothetical protein